MAHTVEISHKPANTEHRDVHVKPVVAVTTTYTGGPAVVFADLYKPLKDFFTKNHTAGKLTLETKTKAPGAVFTAKLEKPNDKDDVSGETGFEYDFLIKQVPLKFKTEGLTSGRVKAKIWSEKWRPWLKTELSSDVALVGKPKDAYELVAEVKKPKYALVGKATCISPGRKTVDLAASYVIEGIHIGGNTVLDADSFSLAKWGLGFRAARGPYTVAALLEDAKTEKPAKDGAPASVEQAQTVKVGVTNKLAVGTIGAEFDYATARKNPLLVTLGAESVLQDGLVFKGRATSAGAITASFIQTWSSALKLTYTSEYDISKSTLKWGLNALYDA